MSWERRVADDARARVNDHSLSVLLPEGWGWLSGDPTLLADTLAALLPADLDRQTFEQFVRRSIDELLALRAGLGPWQIAGLAAWTQEAVIGGEEQVLSASLLMAVLPMAAPVDVEELSLGAERSTLSGRLSAAQRVEVAGRPALRLEGLSVPSADRPAARFSLFLVPTPEIESLVLLHFTTPDLPDWEAFGPLFGAIADTLRVDPIPEGGTADATAAEPGPPESAATSP